MSLFAFDVIILSQAMEQSISTEKPKPIQLSVGDVTMKAHIPSPLLMSQVISIKDTPIKPASMFPTMISYFSGPAVPVFDTELHNGTRITLSAFTEDSDNGIQYIVFTHERRFLSKIRCCEMLEDLEAMFTAKQMFEIRRNLTPSYKVKLFKDGGDEPGCPKPFLQWIQDKTADELNLQAYEYVLWKDMFARVHTMYLLTNK